MEISFLCHFLPLFSTAFPTLSGAQLGYDLHEKLIDIAAFTFIIYSIQLNMRESKPSFQVLLSSTFTYLFCGIIVAEENAIYDYLHCDCDDDHQCQSKLESTG